MSRPHHDVVLAAPISVPYQRETDKPASYFIGTALREMLKTANLPAAECDGLLVSSFSLAPDNVTSLAEMFNLNLNWIEQSNLGGAAGVTGLRRAARAVEAGDAEIIACIGGDTYQAELYTELLGKFSNFTMDAVTPYACGGANLPFAMLTNLYMETYDVSREAMGRLCIMQRENAKTYRNSLFKKSLTMQEYLNARKIAEPLGLFDCVMPCAGAEGFLLMRESTARELKLDYARLLSSGERHNAPQNDDSPMSFGWTHYRDELYSAAGLNPRDIDIAQVYDDYPVMALLQLEQLGLCAQGESTKHITPEGLRLGERTVHVNTSGGQLSSGQAGFAGGFMGIVEAVRQLTTSGLDNQRIDVKTALVSGFGMINYDHGLCTAAAILQAGEE